MSNEKCNRLVTIPFLCKKNPPKNHVYTYACIYFYNLGEKCQHWLPRVGVEREGGKSLPLHASYFVSLDTSSVNFFSKIK